MSGKEILCIALCALTQFMPTRAQERKDSLAFGTQHLKEVIVTGNDPQTDNLRLPQTGLATIKAEDISSTPVLLGEPDLLKTIQTQAGVSNGIEGFAGLYVRGGENDENLYLLNGLPLYNVNHLGGLFSTFNTTTVDKASFYKAGFPAQYGGRVSSITDIRMRTSDFEQYHGQASIGLMAGNVFLTGPIVEDAIAFSIAVRRSWLELVTIPALAIINKKEDGKKKMGRYAFTDLNVKVDYNMAEYGNGYVHFYYGDDYLKLGEKTFSTQTGNDYNDENTTRMRWGNMGAATGLTYRPNTIFSLSANAYYSHYAASFRQNRDSRQRSDGDLLQGYSHKTNENGIDDIGANIQAELTPAHMLQLKAGAEYTHHRYRPEDLVIESNQDDLPQMRAAGCPRISAEELAVWEDNNIEVTHWLQASIGARFVAYSSEGASHTMIEPRANMRVSFASNVSIKASYMRTNQFVQQICNSYISLPTDSWQPIGRQWQPLRSDQVSAGIFGNLPGSGNYFSVEGYYKWLDNLLEYKEEAGSFVTSENWYDKLTQGEGKAYGVDIGVHKNEGRLTGYIGYGLLWNTRLFSELNNGMEFPAKYDNRHKINVSCRYELKKNVELNAAWTYMTGNRMTLALSNYKGLEGSGFAPGMAPTGTIDDEWGINHFTTRNNVRLPAYHRLDVGVNFRHQYSNGAESTLSVGLYNAYSRMNPIAISKEGRMKFHGDSEDEWNTKFRTFSILPVIPSVSYTIKF